MTAVRFAFCPACASELPEGPEELAPECRSCGRIWYQNPAPTAGCVIVQNGKALITKRGAEPEKGRYDIPGGFIEVGESPIDAVKRELREELGIEVDVTNADYVSASPHRYGADGEWTLAIGFRARIAAGDPVAADDVESFEWVTMDRLDAIDFAWDHDRELVREVLKDEGSATG